MAVTRADVLHVASLARLSLDENEIERLVHELNGILAHAEELKGADSERADGASVATQWPAPERTDSVGADRMAFPPMQLSPSTASGFFTVPRLATLDADALSS